MRNILEQVAIESNTSVDGIKFVIDSYIDEQPQLLDAFPEDVDGRAFMHVVLGCTKPDMLIHEAITTYMAVAQLKPSESNILKAYSAIVKACEVTPYADFLVRSATQICIVPKAKLPFNVLNNFRDRGSLEPMICLPRDWTDFDKGGYMTEAGKLNFITKGKSRYVGQDLPYATVNKLQKVPFTIDEFVLHAVNERLIDRTLYKDREMELAHKMVDKSFYYVWRVDSRLRLYSHGWLLNFQGREYQRALHDLAYKEHLNEDGKRALLISIAGARGHGKKTFKFREEWAVQHVADVFGESKEFPFDEVRAIAESSKEPYYYQKFMYAWYEGVVLGKPIGTLVGVDASASGLQLMALASGCETTAKVTNLTDSEERYDAYQEAYKEMKVMYPHIDIDMDSFKTAVMTFFYNSTMKPQEIFPDADELQSFFNVLAHMFKGPMQVLRTINACWEDKPDYLWHDAFGRVNYVVSKVKQSVHVKHEVAKDVVIEFDYEYVTNKVCSGNYRHLPANIIQGTDSAVAAQVIDRATWSVVPIHDDFRSHPNYMFKTRQLYFDVLSELNERNFLNEICLELSDGKIGFEKLNPKLALNPEAHFLS